jgi:hypothetical protein
VSFGFLVLLVAVATTIWVGVDASRRDWGDGTGTAGWVVGCILLWIIFFPIYLAKRGKAPLKVQAVGGAAEVEGGYGLPRAQLYRECPHCKEPMRRDASVCPHCRNESSPWRFHDGRWWFRESEDAPWEWLDESRNEWVALQPVAPPAE